MEPTSTPPSGEVRLREVVEADLPILFEHQWDPEANAMANFPPREREAFMAHWTKIMADETLWARTVLLGNEVVGNVVSWEQDEKQLIGYWIGRAYWGRGIATEAMSAFLKVLTSRPLYAHVARHNVGSIRVLAKSGFTLCSDEVDDLVFKLGDESR